MSDSRSPRAISPAPSPALGQLLRKRREQLGLTRGVLAARLGRRNLSKGSRRISDWEAGRVIPGQATVARLSQVLDLDDASVAAAMAVSQAEVERQALLERKERRLSVRRELVLGLFIVALYALVHEAGAWLLEFLGF